MYVAGYKVFKPRYWSGVLKECYERGGVCDGCYYQQFGCKTKGTMIYAVTKFGKPKDVIRKDILKE